MVLFKITWLNHKINPSLKSRKRNKNPFAGFMKNHKKPLQKTGKVKKNR